MRLAQGEKRGQMVGIGLAGYTRAAIIHVYQVRQIALASLFNITLNNIPGNIYERRVLITAK